MEDKGCLKHSGLHIHTLMADDCSHSDGCSHSRDDPRGDLQSAPLQQLLQGPQAGQQRIRREDTLSLPPPPLGSHPGDAVQRALQLMQLPRLQERGVEV